VAQIDTTGRLEEVRRPTLARLTRPNVVLPLIAIAILSFFVILPLSIMVLASVRPVGTLPFEAGPFTLDAYSRAYTSYGMMTVVKNTLVFATGTVAIGLPIAFMFAYFTERTDMPMRNAMYSLMFIPMSIPVFATALGWVLLLGPRAGTLNQYIRLIFGLDTNEGPFNIFSMEGMIFVQSLGLVPSMWLFLVSVLRNMDPGLEEAGSVSGASKLTILRKVTLPLMRPGVGAVLIFFFIVTVESLELALAIGPTAGIQVLSTKIFFAIFPESTQGVDYAVPAAFGMIGLAMGVIGITFYMYLIRQSSKYAVVTGKAYRPKTVRLGKWRWVALGIILMYMLIKVIIPMGILVLTSFLKFYQPPVPKVWDSMVWTLANYEDLLSYRFFGRYFLNTVITAVGAATVTMILVSFFSWVVVRFPSRLTKAVNVLAFMPLAIPGVISSLAFFLMFIGTPFYGALPILVAAFAARYIAFGTRVMHSAQLQIHRELGEAAMVSGVGVIKTFFFIDLRLLIPAFMNGWLWVLTHAAKDFSVGLILASASSLLVGNVIYGAFQGGDFPISAAMMTVLVVFNLSIVLAGRRWITKAVRG
jgi:iron(III) transport system permease protein